MKPYVLSCDSHVVEPRTLWADNLPASMRDKGLATRKDEKNFFVEGNGKTLLKMQVADGVSGNEKLGRFEIDLRIKDMIRDGVDAEVVYPTVGLMTSRLGDRDLEIASCVVYNDWVLDHFKSHRDIFVPAAILPMCSIEDAATELKRCVDAGFATAMIPGRLPGAVPSYNSEQWDVLWNVAADARIPLILHAGTGGETTMERGNGAALINYMLSGRGPIDAVAYLVSSGALDRFPNLTVATMECGSSYLNYLAEVLDEIYPAHLHYVRPKLSRKPSEIIAQQVKAAFSHDRSAVENRKVLGHETLMFATDYPHLEGSFPHSRAVIAENFRDIDITDSEKADILGLTAAKIFKIANPKVLTEA
ncbi:putative TIM-barrel fold metal-dependent hydrolase [Sphingobium sp. OAS761]|uniref:amidohydrolase family protein n=1 Tax=Sphingobium sp. OAS761 TaxID=2817901 RepID=UPI00209D6567|nr:amidohydrolase family protein [Sphingobium sp. OAS761]MCP1472359.1 putative TIM-barrel fold metal-dependent hydrolase [Sphingobium sp. OAS761]